MTCACGCGQPTKYDKGRKRQNTYVHGHSGHKWVTTPNANGSAHPNWKGADAAYNSIHHWLNRNYPKSGVCEHCSGASRDYANISGEYARDRSDYLELCRDCHATFDA